MGSNEIVRLCRPLTNPTLPSELGVRLQGEAFSTNLDTRSDNSEVYFTFEDDFFSAMTTEQISDATLTLQFKSIVTDTQILCTSIERRVLFVRNVNHVAVWSNKQSEVTKQAV